MPTRQVSPGECVEIATGAPMPAGADAVVMVEETERIEGTSDLHVFTPVYPTQNVGRRGADITAVQPLAGGGDLLSPSRVGALAAAGLAELAAFGRPRIAILSTGNEIADPGAALGPGQIYDVNRFTLAAVVRRHGGIAVLRQPAPDTLDDLGAALDACLAASDRRLGAALYRPSRPECVACEPIRVPAREFRPRRDQRRARARCADVRVTLHAPSCTEEHLALFARHKAERGLLVEEILQSLKLPYRLIQCCTGDLGPKNADMVAIESWMPGRGGPDSSGRPMGAYGETHSASRLYDYQCRRLNMRYRMGGDKGKGETVFCHSLNNTVIASPRVLIPILENWQNADGTVTVPEVLRGYMGKERILPRT